MKSYYEIIKSYWEVFPNEKIRVKRRISYFHYRGYDDAHKAAVKIRKINPSYRYDLGDRIYVRRCRK